MNDTGGESRLKFGCDEGITELPFHSSKHRIGSRWRARVFLGRAFDLIDAAPGASICFDPVSPNLRVKGGRCRLDVASVF